MINDGQHKSWLYFAEGKCTNFISILMPTTHHDRQGCILIHCCSSLESRRPHCQVEAILAWNLVHSSLSSSSSSTIVFPMLMITTSHGRASCCRQTAFMLLELSQTPEFQKHLKNISPSQWGGPPTHQAIWHLPMVALVEEEAVSFCQ